MAIRSPDLPVVHIVPHGGATHSARPKPGKPPPPIPRPGPHDGFIVAFGPIPGVTSHKALPHVFYFQCPPVDVFPTDFSWTWADFATISDGMHSNPNYPNLTTVQFDSMFVLDDAVNDELVLTHSKDSVFERARLLKALGDSMTPFVLQVGSPQGFGEWEPLGRKAQAQVAVTLRSFHWETRSGEPDTRYFTVQVTEYPDAGVLKKLAPPPLTGGTPSGSGVLVNGQRVMRTYDPNNLPKGVRTLRQLAINMYGASSGWRLIANATPAIAKFHVAPDDNLRAALGKRKPAVTIVVPYKPKVNVNDKARTT